MPLPASFWWVAGNLWHFWVCRMITLITTSHLHGVFPLYVCVPMSPFYKGTEYQGVMCPASTHPSDLIFT